MDEVVASPALGHPADEDRLWHRHRELHDPRAREELLRRYLPVARRMAGRYAGVAEPYDDLLQVASLGLLNAIDRFDPSRGVPFRGFAKPTIMGELKRHLRDKVWTVRVPRAIHDLMAKVENASEVLQTEFGRPPSVAELADHLEVEPVQVLQAMEARAKRAPLSLDAPPPGRSDEGGPAEWVGVEEESYERVEDLDVVGSLLPGLGARELEMLRLRFFEEMSQSQIAKRLGCSQMQVSRVLRLALERLRQRAEETQASNAVDATNHPIATTPR
jgi:RNA polymerase sigma-B factor